MPSLYMETGRYALPELPAIRPAINPDRLRGKRRALHAGHLIEAQQYRSSSP